jgi:quercetin dioxygenase-like cupin family protein
MQKPSKKSKKFMKTHTEQASTVVKGIKALEEFIPFLAPRAKAIETSCEGFATIQMGSFENNEYGISGMSQVVIKAGGEHPQHRHDDSENTFLFIHGNGYVILGESQEKIPYSPGTVIKAPCGVLHGFQALEDSLMVALHKGGPILRADGSMDIHYTDSRCFTEHGTVGGD